MGKPRLPNQRKAYKELSKRLARYMMQVRMIYDRLNERAASIVESVGYDGSVEFSFADFPETKRDLQLLQRQFVGDMQSLVYSGTSAEWKRSNLLQDLVANKALKYYRAQVDGEKFKHYYQVNSDQLKAFQRRRERGLNLSAKLWNQSQVYKNSLEATISTAIEKGMSAVTLSKRISKYLNDWPSLQADYQEKFGKATNCYDCEYRSIRLARNEINIAYRTAEQERWKQFDFILGYKIKLSGSHPAKDICDDLQGDYPVEFKFTGWHPNCYAEGTDVYTNDGWKDLKDINGSEKILSLNPITRNLEWTSIIAKQCYYKKEDLVRFYNKSFDCLVTKEHQMVYVSKSNRILNCMASDFRCTQGGIYRNSQYEAKDMKAIKVGNKDVEFDTFCEFMGYYLSDGCCSIKGNGGTIYMAQKIGEPAHDKICSVISRLGYKCYIHDKIIIFSSLEWCKYLSQFGKCNTKYIPREILNASRRQIKIFLDAFIICDGHKRRNNSFMTKGGIMFIPKKDERVYFTTSKRMADELGEAILKVGHHPSFHIDSKKYLNSREHILNGRQIHANFDLHRIAECYRELSTLFKKEYVPYDGFVYDITLERNHIMYVRRNGKCFWGSNCLCYTVPIVMSEDEYWSDDRENSPNIVTAPPKNFGEWVDKAENLERIGKTNEKGTLPYWLKDNSRIKDCTVLMSKARSVGNTIQEQAELIAKKYGGVVTPINYKGFSSMYRKLNSENGMLVSDIKDSVRNTIVVKKENIDSVVKELKLLPTFDRYKSQTPEKFCGYSGNIINLKMPNGIQAEIQVNTPKMIYAKETEANARKILGDKVWEQIAKKTGVEGGLGHKYYEEIRILDEIKDMAKIAELTKLSKSYYEHFR